MKSKHELKPNLFVIGASKSGTTSLHEYLDRHPEISMSADKEPNNFLRQAQVTGYEPEFRKDYRGQFRPGTEVRGESSVLYSSYPSVKGVPEAIAAEVDQPRFIYLVRDPVERIPSLVAHTRSLAERRAIPLRDKTIGEIVGPTEEPLENRMLASGFYMTQLRQYLEFFPKESILVLDSAELRSYPSDVLGEVFRFLGVEDSTKALKAEVNANRSDLLRQKSRPYIKAASSMHLRRILEILPRRQRSALVAFLRVPFSRPVIREELPPDLRERLREVFRPEVEELRRFSGRDFSSWSI